MLNAKENLLECIKGGNPDRYVNGYEAFRLMFYPFIMTVNPHMEVGDTDIPDIWGVLHCYPEGVPTSFPMHTPDKILIKDIEHWQDYVKAPNLDFSQEEWDRFREMYNSVDGTKCFRPVFVAPGLFDHTHNFCSMVNALSYYIENPDEMHDLIKYLRDFELRLADTICTNLHPDSMFHHDDWGTEVNSFMSPAMFEDFFVEPYKEIYGYYRERGCELIIHHADSYAANLVPDMIEIGIDVWQGCMHTNNVPELVKKYGDKITFMGNIDNKSIDFEGWTPEDVRKAAEKGLDECGMKHYIPCITQGTPGSLYKGTYQELTKQVDILNSERFGWKIEDLEAAREPWQYM